MRKAPFSLRPLQRSRPLLQEASWQEHWRQVRSATPSSWTWSSWMWSDEGRLSGISTWIEVVEMRVQRSSAWAARSQQILRVTPTFAWRLPAASATAKYDEARSNVLVAAFLDVHCHARTAGLRAWTSRGRAPMDITCAFQRPRLSLKFMVQHWFDLGSTPRRAKSASERDLPHLGPRRAWQRQYLRRSGALSPLHTCHARTLHSASPPVHSLH